MAQKAHLGVGQVDAGRGLEELDDGIFAVDLQHLAVADVAIGQLDLSQLVVGDALHLAHHHQGAVDLLNGLVFTNHASSPPFTTAWSICSVISRAMSA